MKSSSFNYISAHRVGNKHTDNLLELAKKPLILDSEEDEALLAYFFLSHFKSLERYVFDFPNGDLNLNPVYSYVKNIFNQPESLHIQSVQIANYLFEVSNHPNIKTGDLYVAYFPAYQDDDESTAAVGIFKSESKEPFVQLKSHESAFELQIQKGASVEKLDKGCLILNKKSEEGYRVMIIDKANKSEANYWKNEFLSLKPLANSYSHTSERLQLTKQFVSDELPKNYEIEKTEQIDLLNKTVQYFKEKEQYNEEEFARTIFGDESVADAFKSYRQVYSEQRNLELDDEFAISKPALKQRSKIYKSVLKLDKNFHIYIHGDRSLIEKGVDEQGRKYYKVFYEEER